MVRIEICKKKKFIYTPLNSQGDANFEVKSPKITSDILQVPKSFMEQTDCVYWFFWFSVTLFKFLEGKFRKFKQFPIVVTHTIWALKITVMFFVFFWGVSCPIKTLPKFFIFHAYKTFVCRHEGCRLCVKNGVGSQRKPVKPNRHAYRLRRCWEQWVLT